MNSDKIRAEILKIKGIEDRGERAKATFDLYHRFIDLIAKNKVGMVVAACGTAREIKDIWVDLFPSIGDKVEVTIERAEDKLAAEIAAAKAAMGGEGGGQSS